MYEGVFMPILNKIKNFILRTDREKLVIMGLTVVVAIIGLIFYLNFEKIKKPVIVNTYQNPFASSEYTQANYEKEVWTYKNFKMRNVPGKAETYNFGKEIFPVFKDKTSAERLVANLGFTIEAKNQASGDIIAKVEDNKFFTMSQSGYSVSFFRDLLKESEYLEKGNVLNLEQAENKANKYLKDNKLQTSYLTNSKNAITYAKMTSTGLLETNNKDEAEVTIYQFQPQINDYDLKTDFANNQISFAKNGEVVSFEFKTFAMKEKEKNLKLKPDYKIKQAIENNEGFFLKKCEALTGAGKIEVSSPDLAYFLSEGNNDVQPIYIFSVKAENSETECETTMYLPALRNEYYE